VNPFKRPSKAINASAYLRGRYERGYAHQVHDVDPQPDADGSTAWLEELSQALVEHPDRPRQWVRPSLINHEGGDAA
jgi:hypothetical protein